MIPNRVFTDALSSNLARLLIGKFSTLGVLLFGIGIFGSVGLIHDSIYKEFIVTNFIFSLFSILTLISVAIGVTYWLKTIINKIEITNSKLTKYRIFGEKYYSWSDINSIYSKVNLFNKETIFVETNSGIFSIPLTMKDVYKEYPKLNQSLINGYSWIDENNNSKPITAENCELFLVIKENIAQPVT